VTSRSEDDSVETSVDMLLVRVVELAIADTYNSDAYKVPTGSSNKVPVAFIMSTKSLQPEVPLAVFNSVYYKLASRFLGTEQRIPVVITSLDERTQHVLLNVTTYELHDTKFSYHGTRTHDLKQRAVVLLINNED
jgi:hypothetical protein